MILVFVMPLGFGQWTIREDDTSRSLIAPEHWGFFIWNIPLIMYCCCCCCCWVASVVSNSVQPQRRQPTKLHRPWDSPGKNTGVGCHFLLQCMKVKNESEVAQSCLTLHNPMDCSLPASSVHGILQARVLEWGVIAYSGLPVITNSRSSPKPTSIELVMPFNYLSSSVIPFSSCPQSFPASESLLMNWLFASSDQSIGASVNINEYLGLISLRIDWFNLLAVQGTFKSSPASKFEANIGRNYYIMVCIASHLQASEYIGSVFPPCFL